MNRFEKDLHRPQGAAPRPSIVYRPGQPTLPTGTERYKVAGGGSLVIDIKAGDRLTITDLEGGQACEIVAVGTEGRSDPSLLGAREANDATGLKAILGSDEESALRVRKALARRGIDMGGAKAIRLFGSLSPAGSQQRFTAQRDGVVIVGAPGGKMDAEAQDTATPLDVRVERATLPRANELIALPEPLADPLQEIRIDAATARAYVVRAGEYIQVIDVAGRQMTDFQCFSRRKLDKGMENALDANGDAHDDRTRLSDTRPASKMFGFDFEPLVEVVQDTVGRHDFFATACNEPLLRRCRLSRACQLHRELQSRARSPMGLRRERAGKRSTISTTPASTIITSSIYDEAVVAARRLCADARAYRSRLRVVGLPGRHQCRQWLGSDRHPCSHLFGQRKILESGGLSHDPRRRTPAHARDRVPPALLRAHPQLHRISRLLAAAALQQ